MKVCFFWLLMVAFVFASTQALALSGPVLLGFGDGYVSATGKSSTHRGVDVAMDAGSSVPCPASGQVRFAGRVPGTGGGTVLAVTVDTDAGTVTMLPLQTLAVKAGDAVSKGASVGELAADGDASSGESHLHLGLKHGDLYVDPSELLAAVPSPVPDGKPAEQPALAIETPPAAAQLPDMAPGRLSPADAVPANPSLAVLGSVRPASMPAAAGTPAEKQALTGATSSEVTLGRGVSLAPSTRPAAVSGVPGTSNPKRPVTPKAPTAARPHALPVRAPFVPAPTLFARTAACAGAGAILLMTLVVTVRRTIARRVLTRPRMSDRFGIFVAAPANR